MAVNPPLLLKLSDAQVAFGKPAVFAGVDLLIHAGDKIALVGRNGAGKSTLARLVAGRIEPDVGTRHCSGIIAVGYLEQDVDVSGFETLGDFACSRLSPSERYRMERAAAGLELSPDAPARSASGGERRKAALARMLALEPDLMVLDEPTNHLDIGSVEWLESYLLETSSAFVLISHDRTLLSAVTRRTVWIERGTVRKSGKGFSAFENWRDDVFEAEEAKRKRADRKLRQEARWLERGVTARRRRNQRRLRELIELRDRRKAELRAASGPAMAWSGNVKGSRMVVEASVLSKSFGGRRIVDGFSVRIVKGDRIAFVGPNGAGKTTLLELLTKMQEPDQGTVRHGDQMRIEWHRQHIESLDLDLTVRRFLAGEGVRARDRVDQLMVRGQARQLVSYLRDFLFTKWHADAPLSSLSGGELARLRLAKIMARESDLLVLDEPTNDLDMESLDLLQEALADYPGTVLFASHDRDFIDRAATVTISFDGHGSCISYAGGWTDHLAQKQSASQKATAKRSRCPRKEIQTAGAPATERRGLTFSQAHRLKELESALETLTAEVETKSKVVAVSGKAESDPDGFRAELAELERTERELREAEDEWLALESKREENEAA